MCQLPEKGKGDMGKYRKAVERLKFNSKHNRKKEHEMHFIQVKDASLLLSICRLTQLYIVLCHIKINQNWHRENIRMLKNSEKREILLSSAHFKKHRKSLLNRY